MNAATTPRRLALLVCLLAAGVARGQAGPADAAAGEPAAAPDAARGLGLKWRVPPISTSGTIAYDLRVSRADGEGNGVSHLVTANLSARSYIYQPWFATVSGTLAATMGRSRTTGGGLFQDGAAGPLGSGERFFTGKGRVELFPRSRFPFEFHVDRADSRIDGSGASANDFRSFNLGWSQRYRPETGAWAASAGYDRREQWGRGFRDAHDAVNGDYSTRWKANDLSVGAAWNRSRRAVTDERSEFRTLVARHGHAGSKDWSLNTTVNWTQTLDDLRVGSTDLTVLQWSTVGVWRREQSPLTVSGSVRGLGVRDQLHGAPGLNSFALGLGASYEVTGNLRLNGNGSFVVTDSGGGAAQSFAGSAGASWQGDTIQFGQWRYDWYASGAAGTSASRSSDQAVAEVDVPERQTQSTLNAQVGHTLARNFPLGSATSLALHATQSLAGNASRSGGPLADRRDPPTSRVLLHSVAGTWTAGGHDRQALGRLTYSDSRELGASRARFQLWNFQLSGNLEIGSNRTLSGDLTWQRIQQDAGLLLAGRPGARETSGARNVGGEITYSHQRLFGVPRLRFTSRLKLAQDVLDQPGVLASLPDRETRVWESRLDWVVGRLESRITLRVSEVEGKRREFLMWRLQRNFGD